MPADAPRVKREATLAMGAEIVSYDRATESREKIAAHLAHARGGVLVPSFDDPWIIEGQGVEPDIFVDNDPAREFRGEDQQLDKAIEVILEELRTKGRTLPPPPPGPVKR